MNKNKIVVAVAFILSKIVLLVATPIIFVKDIICRIIHKQSLKGCVKEYTMAIKKVDDLYFETMRNC